MDIKNRLAQCPVSPGIYLMKNAGGKVLYVGKAKNLRNRRDSASLDPRKTKMVEEIKDFEYIITKNELEALVLEANFIKRIKPRYNIVLRDDKNYPYLKLTLNEEWPRLEVTRRIKKDGAVYFGPYVPSGTMREVLKFIRHNFPVRRCRHSLKKPFRPCIQYQMKRCLAPCNELLRTQQHKTRYMETVHDVQAFIQGRQKHLLSDLKEKMQYYSDELKFEEAAEIRDRLKALEKAWETQRAVEPGLGDMDVIGLHREGSRACFFMLFIRSGMVIGQKDFPLKAPETMDNTELLAGFIGQFYSKELLLPPRIVIPVKADMTIQQEWLHQKKGHTVNLSFARNKHEQKVLCMAEDNALYAFNKHRETRVDETLLEIKKLLDLKTIPARIATVDISNISGREATGAVVIYEDGHFTKKDYRLFKIREINGPNDFAMIGETVKRYLEQQTDDKSPLPQLLLIDGGRGQLQSAFSAMGRLSEQIELAAIAKAKRTAPGTGRSDIRHDTDRIYLLGRRSPVYLEPFMASTLLLQRLRDEAHRFAVKHHKKLRANKLLESPLEKVEGIGKKRRLLLLKHFGSVAAIRKAAIEEIASLKGLNITIAQNLKKVL